jgi:hypothetical protein
VLAFGGALSVGTALALFRPPPPSVLRDATDDDEDDRPAITPHTRPPLARSLVMIGIGVVCAVWALASLIHGHS